MKIERSSPKACLPVYVVGRRVADLVWRAAPLCDNLRSFNFSPLVGAASWARRFDHAVPGAKLGAAHGVTQNVGCK
jgi:hypothetical protein